MAQQHRTPDHWKVRRCSCGKWEYDAGPPRGWVPLRGEPPQQAREAEYRILPASPYVELEA